MGLVGFGCFELAFWGVFERLCRLVGLHLLVGFDLVLC